MLGGEDEAFAPLIPIAVDVKKTIALTIAQIYDFES